MDNSIFYKVSTLKVDTPTFYTALTLKLNVRVLVSHPGRRPEGESSTLYTATALKLNLAPIGNTER